MKEIIHIQAGQCGNLIGLKFWEKICNEHAIDPSGKFVGQSSQQQYGLNTYFSEGMNNTWLPRAVLFDLESGIVDTIRANYFGKLFRPDNYIFKQRDAGHLWCNGYYTQGYEVIDEVTDAIRREVENCDSLEGFQLVHSLGGGTGSGMGTLLLTKLQEEYTNCIRQTYSIMPSKNVSDVVVEPYNAVLSINQLIEYADSTIAIDNEALYRFNTNMLRITSPSYGDLNHLVAGAMSCATSPFRSPGMLNCGLRKMTTNLVPFPRIHFFTIAAAPLTARGCCRMRYYTSESLARQVFSRTNILCDVDPNNGWYISACVNFQGKIPNKQTEDWMSKFVHDNPGNFFKWIPDSLKLSYNNISPKIPRATATLIGNNTAIQGMFKRIGDSFDVIFSCKAYVHKYQSEGMDRMEFVEAQANLQDLISEYHTSNVHTADQDEMDEDQNIEQNK